MNLAKRKNTLQIIISIKPDSLLNIIIKQNKKRYTYHLVFPLLLKTKSKEDWILFTETNFNTAKFGIFRKKIPNWHSVTTILISIFNSLMWK